jgi:hypothetical protein
MNRSNCVPIVLPVQKREKTGYEEGYFSTPNTLFSRHSGLNFAARQPPFPFRWLRLRVAGIALRLPPFFDSLFTTASC